MADRPKIAGIVTEYRKYSHAQHICDRFLEGYGWNSRHHHPPMDLVSLYVDQRPEGDLSQDRATRFPHMAIYPTVADALTLGGSDLAVDGVLLIAEHGTYGRNEKDQHLYPRYELFKQIASVYRTTGKSAAIFNDKHLSWNWDWCQEMYDVSQELDFAFMAGSSLPVTWRTPSLDMPLGTEVEEAVCVCYGGVDSYDFHGLETLQCMVERRKGGETGVKWLRAYRDDAFWQAHAEGVWSRELFEACLCRSHTLTPARPGFNNPFPTIDELKHLVESPVAYQYEHADGLISTMMLMNGLVQDSTSPLGSKGQGRAALDSDDCPSPGPHQRCHFFSPLAKNIERCFATAKHLSIGSIPLTSGLVIAGVDSLQQDQAQVETPHLNTAYQATKESTFWRT